MNKLVMVTLPWAEYGTIISVIDESEEMYLGYVAETASIHKDYRMSKILLMLFLVISFFNKKGSGWAIVWTGLSVSIMLYLVIQL